ncbi:unannotated protein [freshwater metagenome]|uniref:Unannotated protein n=1 Tax=freshwater metagenome TaxID=449393 RepID=A0A6J7KUF1_9ZZZZ
MVVVPWRRPSVAAMDIVIMVVLLVAAIAVYRDRSTLRILSLWVVGLVLSLLLFNYHVTSSLDLSF